MTNNKKNYNLSEAAAKLRDKNSSSQERHDAAVAMGKEGGHHSHGGGRKPKDDAQD
ncbi:hypothetical protein NOVO_05340 [Rickettsiales bacterium Ac37b]|nr:hypothetical protein NOVO_05340 [Rickettsiales bacterium Ac37b]